MALADLKAKWFLNPNAPRPPTLPPTARHPRSPLAVSTDGNTVVPLIDGEAYMGVWNQQLTALTQARAGELFHSGWRMEGVRTLGHDNEASDALELLNAADEAGVSVYGLLSAHGANVFSGLNFLSQGWLLTRGVTTVCLDNRFPPAGSNHQKAAVFKGPGGASAMLGSIDISKTRWDRTAHGRIDPRRNGAPTHDIGVFITGPAVGEIEHCFRERWNDETRKLGMEPVSIPQPMITSAVASSPGGGSHSVQVLQVYGKTSETFGYSWSSQGEFTGWAAWINAVQKARDYIYVEDQYFLPFGAPAICAAPDGASPFARATDPIFQLGEAIKRGVRVFVLTPSNAEDATHRYQKHHRDIGMKYLYGCAAGTNLFTPVTLENDGDPVYVHSKLLIVDDEYVLIGSMNVGQRSMTYDGELLIGVVDEAGLFARNLRRALWGEHLGIKPEGVGDSAVSTSMFRVPMGRLRPYPYETPTAENRPFNHDHMMRNHIDPYGGPDR